MADHRPAGQPRVPGRRRHRHVVMLSDEQEIEAQQRADARGVTVARALADALFEAPAVDNTVVVRQVAAVRRLVGGMAVNINQAAKEANSGRFDPSTWEDTAKGVEWANQNLAKHFGWDK